MNNTSNWILTDDDSCQYVKCIEKDKFKLIEMSIYNPEAEEYFVYTDEIDVDEYLHANKSELIEILEAYYEAENEKDVIEFVLKHTESPFQIIAECIFEYYNTFQSYILAKGSEKECRKFIEEYVKNH